jgi:hypothetical protein
MRVGRGAGTKEFPNSSKVNVNACAGCETTSRAMPAMSASSFFFITYPRNKIGGTISNAVAAGAGVFVD